MKIFNSIKKSRRESSDIDEKIEYLNKELEKTGLREAMSTSNIYVNGGRVPNENFNDFNGLSHGGYGLGLSGADGNGAGGGIIGTIEPPDGFAGLSGVAMSPPHPITGKRKRATTITDGTGSSYPLIPGTKSGGNYVRGGALWFFDPTYNFNNAQGRWLNFEWNVSQGSWAFWDTNFLGFYFLNTNLDDYELNGVNIGTQIKNAIAGIDFGTNGEIGTPQTLVLTKNNLDDPGFLPINIDGLSTQGFNYLRGKAGVDVSAAPYYSIEDKKNVINYYKKKQADPNYQPKSFERDSLMRQMRAQGDGPQFASTDPSAEFASAPSDAFEPETVETELTPDNIPDEFKLDDNKPVDDSKPTDEGKAVKLTKWMSRTDYMSKYPNTSMVDYLSSLPYGPSDFMTPNPNFPGAWDQNYKGYENYFMNGDLSALGNREGTPKPRHSTTTPDKAKKWGGKTKEEILAELDADISKYTAAEKAAHQEMRSIALELGMDFVSLIGGLFTGGTTAAPVLGKLGVKLLKKYGKTVAGKMIRKLVKRFRNKKNSKQLDDIIDSLEEGGNDPEAPPRKPFEPDKGDSYGNLSKGAEAKFDTATERLMNQRRQGGKDGDLAGKFLDDLNAAAEVSDTAFNSVMNKIKKSPIGYLFNSYTPDGKVLSEEAKLGHFEPEQLNVNIEDLRKGIMPEFPKDPPPEMVNGYNPKSRLAPKELERTSFIKITKKDLAKNHRLKDSEIKDFMDTINAVNDFIKKHPEELVYAQTRYPKNDPRLAQLNWQMDQKLNASKEYMDKHYPENQKLFTKIQKSIKKNIELTDPKSFKGVKVPKFEGVDLTDFKRRKEVVARHYKKAVKTKKLFSRKKT